MDELSCYPIDDFFESQAEYFMSCSSFVDAIEQYAKTYALYISTTGPLTCKTVILSMGSDHNSKFVSESRSVNRILWDIIVKFQKNGEVSTRFLGTRNGRYVANHLPRVYSILFCNK